MIIYTKTNCQPCQELKSWLDKRNIKYEERNILERDHAQEYRALNSKGVPYVITDLKDDRGKSIAFIGNRIDLLEVIYPC